MANSERKTPDWVAEIEFQGLHVDIAELSAQLKDVLYTRYIIVDNIVFFITMLVITLAVMALPISQRYRMNEWSRSQFVDVPFFVRTFPDSKDNLAKEEIKSFEHIDSLPKWQAWVDQAIWPNIENKEALIKYPNVLLTGVRFRQHRVRNICNNISTHYHQAFGDKEPRQCFPAFSDETVSTSEFGFLETLNYSHDCAVENTNTTTKPVPRATRGVPRLSTDVYKSCDDVAVEGAGLAATKPGLCLALSAEECAADENRKYCEYKYPESKLCLDSLSDKCQIHDKASCEKMAIKQQPDPKPEKAGEACYSNDHWSKTTCAAFGFYFGRECQCNNAACSYCRNVPLADTTLTTQSSTTTVATAAPKSSNCYNAESFGGKTLKNTDRACRIREAHDDSDNITRACQFLNVECKDEFENDCKDQRGNVPQSKKACAALSDEVHTCGFAFTCSSIFDGHYDVNCKPDEFVKCFSLSTLNRRCDIKDGRCESKCSSFKTKDSCDDNKNTNLYPSDCRPDLQDTDAASRRGCSAYRDNGIDCKAAGCAFVGAMPTCEWDPDEKECTPTCRKRLPNADCCKCKKGNCLQLVCDPNFFFTGGDDLSIGCTKECDQPKHGRCLQCKVVNECDKPECDDGYFYHKASKSCVEVQKPYLWDNNGVLSPGSISGHLAEYPSAGFNFDLKYDCGIQYKFERLDEMKSLFIDNQTRTVITEVTWYNYNFNMYGQTFLMLEVSEFGGVLPSHTTHLAQVPPTSMDLDYMWDSIGKIVNLPLTVLMILIIGVKIACLEPCLFSQLTRAPQEKHQRVFRFSSGNQFAMKHRLLTLIMDAVIIVLLAADVAIQLQLLILSYVDIETNFGPEGVGYEQYLWFQMLEDEKIAYINDFRAIDTRISILAALSVLCALRFIVGSIGRGGCFSQVTEFWSVANRATPGKPNGERCCVLMVVNTCSGAIVLLALCLFANSYGRRNRPLLFGRGFYNSALHMISMFVKGEPISMSTSVSRPGFVRTGAYTLIVLLGCVFLPLILRSITLAIFYQSTSESALQSQRQQKRKKDRSYLIRTSAELEPETRPTCSEPDYDIPHKPGGSEMENRKIWCHDVFDRRFKAHYALWWIEWRYLSNAIQCCGETAEVSLIDLQLAQSFIPILFPWRLLLLCYDLMDFYVTVDPDGEKTDQPDKKDKELPEFMPVSGGPYLKLNDFINAMLDQELSKNIRRVRCASHVIPAYGAQEEPPKTKQTEEFQWGIQEPDAPVPKMWKPKQSNWQYNRRLQNSLGDEKSEPFLSDDPKVESKSSADIASAGEGPAAEESMAVENNLLDANLEAKAHHEAKKDNSKTPNVVEEKAEAEAQLEQVDGAEEEPPPPVKVYNRSIGWWCSVYLCCCFFQDNALYPDGERAVHGEKKKSKSNKVKFLAHQKLPRNNMRRMAAKNMALDMFTFFRQRLINETGVARKRKCQLQPLPQVQDYSLMLSQSALESVSEFTKNSSANFTEQIEMRREHQDSIIDYMKMINLQIARLRSFGLFVVVGICRGFVAETERQRERELHGCCLNV